MLNNYECTKCERIPTVETDVLMGCPCGNRFFRNRNKKVVKITTNPKNQTDNLGTINVEGVGVYRIDVDSLFQDSKTKIVAVADKKGVVHLNLD